VNATLFSQIQKLLERTYAQVGINLEDCLIDRHRCAQLSILAGIVMPFETVGAAVANLLRCIEAVPPADALPDDSPDQRWIERPAQEGGQPRRPAGQPGELPRQTPGRAHRPSASRNRRSR